MLRFGSEPDERVPSNLRDRLLEGRVGSIAVGSYEGRPMCWESRVGSKLEKRRSCGYLKSEIAGQSIISFDYLVLTLTYPQDSGYLHEARREDFYDGPREFGAWAGRHETSLSTRECNENSRICGGRAATQE